MYLIGINLYIMCFVLTGCYYEELTSASEAIKVFNSLDELKYMNENQYWEDFHFNMFPWKYPVTV